MLEKHRLQSVALANKMAMDFPLVNAVGALRVRGRNTSKRSQIGLQRTQNVHVEGNDPMSIGMVCVNDRGREQLERR